MYIEMPYVFIPVKLTYIPPIYDKQHKHNFGDYTVKIYVCYENDQTYGYQYHEKDQTPDDYCGKTRTMEEI